MAAIYFAWAGADGRGPLPDGGGTLDQAALMWDALQEMQRAHSRLTRRERRS